MNTFKVVAVQTHKVQSDSNSEKMYKVLKADTVYYLLGGYELKDGMLSQTDKPISIYGDKIEVSAVVGENGSGKSSLIELMIRAINNFACYLLGEFRVNNAAEHLHYIENVNVTIHFIQDGKKCHLYIHDRQVVLQYDEKEIFNSENNQAKVIEDNPLDKPEGEQFNISECTFIEEYKGKLYSVLSQFFYTIVNNYSIYAYNSNDFSIENTNIDKAKHLFYHANRIFQPGTQWEIQPDDYNWLKGVFYKNDGYTTPVVLTPMRCKGNIDINSENNFAQLRMLSMLLYKNTKTGEFPFRQINRHKTADKIKLNGIDDRFSDEVKFEIELSDKISIHKDNISRLKTAVIEAIKEILDIGDYNIHKKPYITAAENYLIYKTIKIAKNHHYWAVNYHKELSTLVKDDLNLKINCDKIKKLTENFIKQLILNPSHITMKWRQVAALLKFQLYDIKEYTIEEMEKLIRDTTNRDMVRNFYPSGFCGLTSRPQMWEDIDLLPPALLTPQVQIYDKTARKQVPFNTLSSGERQMIYFVYGFAYHLLNVNSAHTDKNDRAKYNSVFSVFEEIELYFHPDMQRLLVKRLIDAIQSLDLQYINGIHLLFVTHSPFILSDIPQQNCLLLNNEGRPRKKEEKEKLQTFGANIFDILRSGFFLENGFIGQFAFDKINEVSKATQTSANYRELISLIDDPYVRTYLEDKLGRQGSRCERMHELEQELEQLRKECKDEQN